MEPVTREETYLNRMATGEGDVPEPVTRKEEYYERIIEAIEGGGGGPVKGNALELTSEEGAPTGTLNADNLSDDQSYALPDQSGTLALTSDLLPIEQALELDRTVGPAPTITATDAAPINAEDITVDITPIQDLHGYDRPWAGGAGKNKLPMTVDGIKAANTGGSWSGNVYSINNGTFEILVDSANNVIGIKINGTFNAQTTFMHSWVINNSFAGMKLNGNPSPAGAGDYTQIVMYYKDSGGWQNEAYQNSGADLVIADYAKLSVGFLVRSGKTVNNLTINPMIRLATETDPTFAPYSNICPIEGWTGAELDSQGQQYTASFGETVYGGKWHVTEGGTDKTHANIANYNGETINEPWLSSMDEYSTGATPTTGAQVVYPLTNPTTISTPKQNVSMLKGINTVYADCGDTQLKYQPDNVVGELKEWVYDTFPPAGGGAVAAEGTEYGAFTDTVTITEV